MKTMFTLSQLAAMLDSQSKAKADFILPANSLIMQDDASIVLPTDGLPRQANTTGHGQVAEYTGIPKPYYDRMLEQDRPLLARNVNEWLGRKGGERRMVRVLDDKLRAVLSDRYQRIDNDQVAEVTLNVLARIPNVRVVSSAITETRLYIKAVSYDVTADIPGASVGDTIAAGVMISNSEVGMGAVSIKGFVERLVCKNGMVRDDGRLRANHVGRRADESIEGLLSDETRRLEDEVVLRKVRDVVRHAFDSVQLQMLAKRLGDTRSQIIEGDVPAAVEALGPATLGLSVGERQSVLRHLIEGGDLSRFGLIQAVTRTAEDVESYDRATEIETLGYKLVNLADRQWQSISRAKPMLLEA